MADFEQALAKTLAYEGGFVNDPDDPGGMTYCGISQAFPNWEGWKTIEEIKKSGRTPALEAQLRKDVARLYYTEFWQPLHGDEIASQEIAEYLFDFAVNSGIESAVKALQWALGFDDRDIDGILGKKTLATLNSLKYGHACLQLFRQERIVHYMRVIAANPNLAKFARGWVRRALV